MHRCREFALPDFEPKLGQTGGDGWPWDIDLHYLHAPHVVNKQGQTCCSLTILGLEEVDGGALCSQTQANDEQAYAFTFWHLVDSAVPLVAWYKNFLQKRLRLRLSLPLPLPLPRPMGLPLPLPLLCLVHKGLRRRFNCANVQRSAANA
jgi:hypothetical protein